MKMDILCSRYNFNWRYRCFLSFISISAGANAEDTRLGGAGSSAVLNFTEITRGPNNETVSNESSTNFYLPDMIDSTAVDERIFEVAVVSGNPSNHPYYNTGSTNKYSINGSTATADVLH